MPLGHEFSAIVAGVGVEVRSIAPGTRVVVNPLAASNDIGNGGTFGAFGQEVLVRNIDAGGVLFPRITHRFPLARRRRARHGARPRTRRQGAGSAAVVRWGWLAIDALVASLGGSGECLNFASKRERVHRRVAIQLGDDRLEELRQPVRFDEACR